MPFEFPDFLEETGLRTDHIQSSAPGVGTLSEERERELREHAKKGHIPRDKNCPVCITSDGPAKIHKSKPELAKGSHTMHVDLASPYERSVGGYHYILICALRLRGAPMVIFGSCLKTKGAAEVVQEIASLVNWIESLNVGYFLQLGRNACLGSSLTED